MQKTRNMLQRKTASDQNESIESRKCQSESSNPQQRQTRQSRNHSNVSINVDSQTKTSEATGFTNTRVTRSLKSHNTLSTQSPNMGLRSSNSSGYVATNIDFRISEVPSLWDDEVDYGGSEGLSLSDQEASSTDPPTVDTAFPTSGRTNLAAILLNTDLFNISTLKIELETLKGRANLCPSKFRDTRLPYMTSKSNFGRVPSALPLPHTEGPTLVEEMIHLGELCHWITQKNEHIWLYQRALSQKFYEAMIQLHPIFDLVRLKLLFKESVGAAICSKKLIDAIEIMIDWGNAPGSSGKVFTFNAKEILGEQFQEKFCSSVEVVMKPYRGRDIYGHKAQHFREVFLWLTKLNLDCLSDVFPLAIALDARWSG